MLDTILVKPNCKSSLTTFTNVGVVSGGVLQANEAGTRCVASSTGSMSNENCV